MNKEQREIEYKILAEVMTEAGYSDSGHPEHWLHKELIETQTSRVRELVEKILKEEHATKHN